MGRKEYYMSRQRCIRCGKQDAYTMSGHQHCYECTEKNQEACKKTYYKHHEDRKKVMRERYERLKAEGMCVECGQKKARPGKVMCERCAYKNNQNAKRWQLKKERSAENG
jgi:NMD protein affecting ribosome stability and mRNA decay